MYCSLPSSRRRRSRGARLAQEERDAGDPDEIARITEEYLLSLVPDCVTAEVLHSHGASPVVVSCDSDLFRAAERAIEMGFGRKPVLIREGGSIPVVNTFKEELGIDSILIGL